MHTKGKILKSSRKKKSRKSQEGKAVRGSIVRNLEFALLGLKASKVICKSYLWGLENKVREMPYIDIWSKKNFLFLTLKSSLKKEKIQLVLFYISFHFYGVILSKQLL